jgi:hypothetical protein
MMKNVSSKSQRPIKFIILKKHFQLFYSCQMFFVIMRNVAHLQNSERIISMSRLILIVKEKGKIYHQSGDKGTILRTKILKINLT